MARDGELIQTQYFCHHADTVCHPNSSYVTTKLYETSACGCNNNTIFQNELFSRFLPSTYVACRAEAFVKLRKSQDGDTGEFILFRVKNFASA